MDLRKKRIMNKVLGGITPLLLLFLFVFGKGIYVFTKDPGEEGWGYVAAVMICLFSLAPLLLDLALKGGIKDRKKVFLIQLPLAILIVIFYLKWGLIGKV
ncbi:MAG: hypothetical protein H6563_01120 [Lewinellaceae bacterium]|nr:hypothetical protein [Lewinellaceae bacterium]